mmetsp:Transcript_31934/g.85493  ORF Transcript_31934/g.85493 Transcript_31934/m.85493 type:complete len:91 (-) Transcript_31934:925-1197(-)
MLVRIEASTLVTGHAPANLGPCEAACACPIAARSETPLLRTAGGTTTATRKTEASPSHQYTVPKGTWFQHDGLPSLMREVPSCHRWSYLG